MIKASYEVLQPASGHSFLVRKFGRSAFDAPYHFHEEFELTCIVHGNGKRYVGSHMEDFSSGDLVLLGSNLPHCWKLEPDQHDAEEPSAIVIQFSANFLGEDFFGKPGGRAGGGRGRGGGGGGGGGAAGRRPGN